MTKPARVEILNQILHTLLQGSDWRDAFESILLTVHQYMFFDHVVVFAPPEEDMETLFARAVGRGRMAEAEVDWGLDFIQSVFEAGEAIVSYPANLDAETDRNRQPFFWGAPVVYRQKILAGLVLVRFGGPPYTEDDRVYSQVLVEMLALALILHRFEKSAQRLERLEKQMRLQDDFVSTISHDLRTPLGFIKGYTTTLLREDTQWDRETRREFLQIIDEEADHLADLIEKVLESARLQSDTIAMNFQWVRLDVLIRDAVVRALSRDKTLEVNLDLPDSCPPIMADSTRLSQVLENLFSNARKYAPGAPIQIRVQVDDPWIYIAFSDRGPGISPEHLPYLFDRFYRVTPKPGVKGTGLGLYICSEIVRAHGGEIWVESQIGSGTTFFVKLPMQTPKKGEGVKDG